MCIVGKCPSAFEKVHVGRCTWEDAHEKTHMWRCTCEDACVWSVMCKTGTMRLCRVESPGLGPTTMLMVPWNSWAITMRRMLAMTMINIPPLLISKSKQILRFNPQASSSMNKDLDMWCVISYQWTRTSSLLLTNNLKIRCSYNVTICVYPRTICVTHKQSVFPHITACNHNRRIADRCQAKARQSVQSILYYVFISLIFCISYFVFHILYFVLLEWRGNQSGHGLIK